MNLYSMYIHISIRIYYIYIYMDLLDLYMDLQLIHIGSTVTYCRYGSMCTRSLHGIAMLSIGFVHPLFGSFSVNISVSLPELGMDDKQLLVILTLNPP